MKKEIIHMEISKKVDDHLPDVTKKVDHSEEVRDMVKPSLADRNYNYIVIRCLGEYFRPELATKDLKEATGYALKNGKKYADCWFEVYDLNDLGECIYDSDDYLECCKLDGGE